MSLVFNWLLISSKMLSTIKSLNYWMLSQLIISLKTLENHSGVDWKELLKSLNSQLMILCTWSWFKPEQISLQPCLTFLIKKINGLLLKSPQKPTENHLSPGRSKSKLKKRKTNQINQSKLMLMMKMNARDLVKNSDHYLSIKAIHQLQLNSKRMIQPTGILSSWPAFQTWE